MARQAGPLYFTGTIDDITFYKMEGTYYARKKTSLDRKQFRTDPRFKRSRAAAATFGEASKLASTIYWQLPKELRGKGVVNRLTASVGSLLKEGYAPEEVKAMLLQQMGVISSTSQPLEQASSTPSKVQECTALSAWGITQKGTLVKTPVNNYIPANLERPNLRFSPYIVELSKE